MMNPTGLMLVLGFALFCPCTAALAEAEPFVGVNLGGLLVLENWLHPALFYESKEALAWKAQHGDFPKDERELIQSFGGNRNKQAIGMMHKIWDSFFTESDLDLLTGFGVNHFRIPVGYWLVDYRLEDGFVDGGLFYLNRTLQWLHQKKAKAILDLHALPGAQTPQQSFTGCFDCYAMGMQFWNEPYLSRGKEAMMKLARLIRLYEKDPHTQGVVIGMELVNEPDATKWPETQKLYEEMVPKIRTILPASNYSLYLNSMAWDKNQDTDWMKKAVYGPDSSCDIWSNVIYDRHMYHAYGDDDQPGALVALRPTWTPQMDTCKTCCRDAPRLSEVYPLQSVIGEWSLTVATFDLVEYKEVAFLNNFWINQLSLYTQKPNRTTGGFHGSFFWNFKVGPSDGHSDYFVNFNLVQLIQYPYNLMPPRFLNLSTYCPNEALDKCPHPEIWDWERECLHFPASISAADAATIAHYEAEQAINMPLTVAAVISGVSLVVLLAKWVTGLKEAEEPRLIDSENMMRTYGT